MRKEYLDLDAVGGLTVETSSLNLIRELKSNQETLASNLKNEIQEGLVETLQALNLTSRNQENIDPNIQYAPPPPQYQPPIDTSLLSQFGVNQISTSTTIAQLLQEMKDMKCTIIELKNGQANSKSSSSGTINPRTGQPWKRYCWSCGCCTHWSRNCPAKKKGHQDNATFKDRMGGSNENCK